MENNEQILYGKICPYCGSTPIFTDSAEVYGGRSYGMILLCRPCNAYVGVHKGTNTPLGRLANHELRNAKKKAHLYFDSLWKQSMSRGWSKYEARTAAYKWLSKEMGKTPEHTHIGMFNIEECERVVEICSPYAKVVH